MKHLFIVNPVAGRTKPEDKIRLVHEALGRIPASERGEHEIYVTSAPMDACGKIRQDARCASTPSAATARSTSA